MRANVLHDLPLNQRRRFAFRLLRQNVRAQVGGEDDDGIFEIDGAALTIRQTTVVENLEQHVEHILVRFFDLVEQDHLVGTAPHGLGQDTALVVTDITRGRADQTGHGVFLHEFAHVDAHHGLVVVEQKFGERLGQLGLPHPGRAEEQEAADRPVRVLQPGAGAADAVGDGFQRLFLANDAFA